MLASSSACLTNTGCSHLPGNNGALWQLWPSLQHGPAWTNTRRRAVSAQVFKGSRGRLETWPKLPLWPEQEVGAVLIPSTWVEGESTGTTLGKRESSPQPPIENKHTHAQEAAPSAGSPPQKWTRWSRRACPLPGGAVRGEGSRTTRPGTACGPGCPISPEDDTTILACVPLLSHISHGIAPFPEGDRLGVKGPAQRGGSGLGVCPGLTWVLLQDCSGSSSK